jgi:ribosomal protein L5
MQVPKLEKIVISKGVGAAVSDKKINWSFCRRNH